MKKQLLLLIFLFCVAFQAVALHVELSAAREAGKAFLIGSAKFLKPVRDLDLVYTAQLNSSDSSVPAGPAFYVFNFGQQGFVIISGDDQVIPVLGYSDEGSFNPASIPLSVQKWLDGYVAQIRYTVQQNVPATATIKEQWKQLLSGAVPQPASAQSVAPLVLTKWDQRPFENLLCPFDNAYNERTVTGCPATAMAQIMKYWNYPNTGSGFHSYNHQSYGTLSANFGSTSYQWGSMPNILTSPNSAVSTLMYQCGVAVQMDYGVAATGGSGSYVIVAASPSPQQTCENAFKTYFRYNSSTLQGLKRANYTDAAWINLLKNELNINRPLQYAGFGSGGGHTFVCDGYDNNNFFHMNWGWGGNSDGYFALNSLNPGSLGAGGGAGGFNSNQQALIGIQPPSGSGGGGGAGQTIDMRLYAPITMPSTDIWFTSGFSLSVNIANFGTGTFSGQLGAAVFDASNNFVDFMEVKSNMSLSANSYFTNPLTFSHPGSAAFVPGSYSVSLFYKTASQDWTIIGNGNYFNNKQFEINYSADIEPYSAFNITSNGGKLIQGSTATVNIDLTNTSSSTFFGNFRVNLSNLDGSWVQNIQVLNENSGLPSTYHYPGGLNFTGVITALPGTYLMELAYQEQGTNNWYYAGSTNYSNPVYVIVEAAGISPDAYENNNSVSTAFSLPIVFSGNTSSINTLGSNLHIGTDNDFYKISLPAGFNYTVTARLHDSYNSGNGTTYTVDGLFSYSTNNGSTWSDNFDDVLPNTISVSNGGSVIFRAAPYFAGGTGTYLLDLSITRTAATTVGDFLIKEKLKIFPNPASDFVQLDLHEFPSRVKDIRLLDFHGKLISTHLFTGSGKPVEIPLQGLPNGVYFICLQTSEGIIRQKLLKGQ
jgi:hypothetical protein